MVVYNNCILIKQYQFTWSTMPSNDERTVGCISLCSCIILEQRHMGKVAFMVPASPVEPLLEDDALSLTLLLACI